MVLLDLLLEPVKFFAGLFLWFAVIFACSAAVNGIKLIMRRFK